MMRVKLVFDDWRQKGRTRSIYNTDLGVSLSMRDLHSGSTFDGRLFIDPETEDEILRAWKDHSTYPVFWLIPDLNRLLFMCKKCGEEVGEGEEDHNRRHGYCGGELDPIGEIEDD